MIRVIGCLAGLAILLIGGRAVLSDPGDPPPTVSGVAERTPESIVSGVRFATDPDGYTVTYYSVAADEALVLRFADAGMDSCDINVRRGPVVASWRSAPGLDVDYAFAPRDRWRASAEQMGQPCAESWITSS